VERARRRARRDAPRLAAVVASLSDLHEPLPDTGEIGLWVCEENVASVDSILQPPVGHREDLEGEQLLRCGNEQLAGGLDHDRRCVGNDFVFDPRAGREQVHQHAAGRGQSHGRDPSPNLVLDQHVNAVTSSTQVTNECFDLAVAGPHDGDIDVTREADLTPD
jgi:hypothetical protein